MNKSVQAQIEDKWRQAITLKYTSLNAYRVGDISFRKYGDAIISVLTNYQVHNRLWNVMELQCFTNQIMMHLPESVLQIEQRDNELFLFPFRVVDYMGQEFSMFDGTRHARPKPLLNVRLNKLVVQHEGEDSVTNQR